MKRRPKTFFYGWVIVAVGALTVFFSSPGQTFSVSIFIDYYIDEFGWSRAQISSFYSIATLISGFSMPFVGKLIDSRGHRASTVMVSVLFSITLLFMSTVSAPWMIFIGFIFLRMFGQGSLSLIPSVLIPQWFIRKRGRALSLISIGGVLGSALVPPLNNYLIESRSLAFAWIFWSVLLATVMLPAGFFLIRNRPEDVGLRPDGVLPEPKMPKGDTIVPAFVDERSWTLPEAKATRAFWLMLLASVVPALVNTAVTFHMVSIMGGKGHEPFFGAYILSITALTQMPMTFLAGFVMERFKVHQVKAMNFLFLGGILLLLNYGSRESFMILYAMMHGTFMAFDSVSTGVLWSNYYGRTHLGKIRGLTLSAMVLGSALGPLPFGAAFDFFGGYREILLLSLIFPAFASIASFLSPPPVYKGAETTSVL